MISDDLRSFQVDGFMDAKQLLLAAPPASEDSPKNRRNAARNLPWPLRGKDKLTASWLDRMEASSLWPQSKFIRLVDEYRLPCFRDGWRELVFETGTTVAHRWKSVEIAPIVYCIQYRYWNQSINQIQFRTQEKEDEEEKETKDGTEDKETADASCLSEV